MMSGCVLRDPKISEVVRDISDDRYSKTLREDAQFLATGKRRLFLTAKP
jgi:hypothetical protein